MPKPGCPEQSGLCDDAATFLLWKVARPQAEHLLKQNRGFAAAAASFFLSDQKETKESPGDVAFGKDLRLAPWSFMSHFPPDPRFYGSVERVPRQLRPARKPHERCPCLLTAVLLNKPDRQLLQGTMRLGGASYTVGSARSAHNVRPYEQNEPPRVSAGGHMGPPLRNRLPNSYLSQQCDARLFACLHVLLVPQGGLHLADVGLVPIRPATGWGPSFSYPWAKSIRPAEIPRFARNLRRTCAAPPPTGSGFEHSSWAATGSVCALRPPAMHLIWFDVILPVFQWRKIRLSGKQKRNVFYLQ